MSLAKLQKQLVRDIKRSPGKAAILGVLFVVAIYFWAPLVLGWSQKEQPKKSSLVVEAGMPTAAPAPIVPTAAKEISWKELVQQIENDPRMQTAALSLKTSSPFGIAAPSTEEEAEEPVEAVESEQWPDMSQFQLQLSSTLLGPRRRIAVINGRPYTEGSPLEAGGGTIFVVARVLDRKVILEYRGRQFELSMPER